MMLGNKLSRRFLAAMGGLFVVAIIIAFAVSPNQPKQKPENIQVGQSNQAISPTASVVSYNSPSDALTVLRVIDGDTIEVDFNGKPERVRYIGMDTPETVHPEKLVQCFGQEASQKNKELVAGKKVRLEGDITDRDKYGRLLRYVYAGDTFVNLELVKQGYATAYTYPPDVKYAELFVEAQKEARVNRLGLWQACQSQTAGAVPNQAPISPSGTYPSQLSACNIKGNINAKGEKIYHVVGCGSYGKTTIDEGAGEHWFCSEKEALDAGWRKALNCN
ncbi:MAG: thermonuclease family protein [Parcubacteria group bacterium]|nr:thermonuclease family protein [Parcubacteria group bacterium]